MIFKFSDFPQSFQKIMERLSANIGADQISCASGQLIEFICILINEDADNSAQTAQEIVKILSLKTLDEGQKYLVNLLQQKDIEDLIQASSLITGMVLDKLSATSVIEKNNERLWTHLLFREHEKLDSYDNSCFVSRMPPPESLSTAATSEPLMGAAQALEDESMQNAFAAVFHSPIAEPGANVPQFASAYTIPSSLFSEPQSTRSPREMREILKKWTPQDKVSYLTTMLRQVNTYWVAGNKEFIGKGILLGIPPTGTPNPTITFKQEGQQIRLIYDGSRLLVSPPHPAKQTADQKTVEYYVTQCLEQLSVAAFFKYLPEEGEESIENKGSAAETARSACTIQ